MYYSNQDGKRLDEKLVEAIQTETQNIFENLEDKINEENPNQSMGKKKK